MAVSNPSQMQDTSVFISSYCAYICIFFSHLIFSVPSLSPILIDINIIIHLSYNVTSENIIRFIFLQFILSSCGCMTQRMCFQIVLFKITFDSSFLYGSVNQQDV